ncbi:hypothetical protein [Streptomyces vinaceus]|uniref:hypothetical protein n=1 Tax=Streptomyces vinaceus TaxID=1960 RepID=UPI00142F1707|nr:hypothetical protein [Streptomyces vinaceus]GHE59689.1 hypothetical protein GCM10017778_50330 [Streptomyces vinaceus]
MSTPEEQQNQQNHQHQQQPRQEPDPYGTQTWQSDTWETGYQPVHQVQPAQPPPGALPGQPVAPEGWFRDEAPAARPQAQGRHRSEAAAPEQSAYQPPQQQPAAPEGWFRDEAAGVREEPPATGWAPGGAVWSDGSAAERTAYLPPQTAAPAADAAETAYLPPYPGPGDAGQQAAAAPPYPGSAAGGQQPAGPVYPGSGAAAAAETAYLPPYPGPGEAEPQAQAVAPDGWFRDEAGAGSRDAWAEGSAAEQTAYLPPQAAAPQGAAEQTAFLPPYPGPAAADTAYPGPGSGEPAAAAATAAVAGADGEEPAYSPPTVGGNTLRAVDPAQARAEGRSPIIDPGPQPAILTAALGLLLAGAAAVGELVLLGPLIVLQGLTAAGWFRLNGMWPARQGIALAFLGALVADAAVLAVDDTYGPGAIIGTLGAWVLLTLVLQLRSHADPDERMYGLMASVASAALAIVCAGYLAADSAAVSVGAAAVAVAVFTRALPLPTPVSVGVSLAAATGAGIAVGGLTPVGVGGALVGLAAGVCALVGLRVAAYDYPSKFVHMTAGVALPLAAAAPAVYLIGRVVG